MKKLFFAVFFIFSMLALFSFCNENTLPENKGDEIIYTPPPNGVYIAGTADGQCCYWNGDKRIDLGDDKNYPEYISVSDGIVLVINDNGIYWVDGERYEVRNFTNRKVIIRGGKEYKFEGSIDFWIDRVQIKDILYFNSVYHDFSFYDFDVFNGKMYIAGIYNVEKKPLYITGNGPFLANLIDTNTEVSSFIPKAIAVGYDGTVYIAGQNLEYKPDKAWYYSEGIFYELEEFDNSYQKYRITVSDGKVYIFPNISYVLMHVPSCSYWVDGKKVSVNAPAGYMICYITVHNEKLYMTGFYHKVVSENIYTTAACYWIDGVCYYLDGSAATAIFVEE